MFTLAIHGGAGTILRELMSAEKEKLYHEELHEAIQCGTKILITGGSSLDAVEACVRSLENCSLFNAGRGAVFTHQGKNELDASIMEGKNQMAGAVAGVSYIKNPVTLAKTIMQNSEHVLMCGNGAFEFAKQNNIEIADDEYFFVQHRYEQWLSSLKEDTVMLDHSGQAAVEKKFGTVGAVALDVHGNIAAATSTGGMTNKKFGRVGDTSIIGSGTYANNNTCAVSCTGHGEFFIRSVVAYDVSCLMEYKGFTLQQACDEVVKNKLVKMGGEGGLIALDARGNICLSFNSAGMYRGYSDANGKTETAIYE